MKVRQLAVVVGLALAWGATVGAPAGLADGGPSCVISSIAQGAPVACTGWAAPEDFANGLVEVGGVVYIVDINSNVEHPAPFVDGSGVLADVLADPNTDWSWWVAAVGHTPQVGDFVYQHCATDCADTTGSTSGGASVSYAAGPADPIASGLGDGVGALVGYVVAGLGVVMACLLLGLGVGLLLKFLRRAGASA
jgi:hypothetical protein